MTNHPNARGPREVLVIRATPGAPLACDMTGASDTPEERLAEYGRLFSHALVERQRDADGVRLRFALKPGVIDWVADLVRREAACCPFFSYELTIEQDRLAWRTSSEAGAAARAILDELYALPEHCGEGIDAYFERLERRGVSVVSPAPQRLSVRQSGT